MKKNFAVSIAVSPTKTYFAVYCLDRKIRLFEYKSGKVIKQFEERMKVHDAIVQRQVAKNASSTMII
jgi:hypothetical protein